MAKIYPNQLIKLFKQALNEHWGYIWGASGETWTQIEQDNADRDMTIKYGQQWVGKRVADCSGLFSWAFKSLGGYMYHGSNTMWKKYCISQGKLKKGKRTDGNELKPGSAVFMCKLLSSDYYHVGLYIGNGEVIEAEGTQNGVVKSKVSTWTHWGELKGVEYSESVDIETDTTVYTELGQRLLKRTSPCMEGEDIKKLQTKLNALGYVCGSADGLFGAKTENALKQFQLANNIEADGIFGQASLTALNNVVEPDGGVKNEVDASEPMQTYITIQGDTLWNISKRFLGSGPKYKKIMEANGLKSTLIRPGMTLTIPDA